MIEHDDPKLETQGQSGAEPKAEGDLPAALAERDARIAKLEARLEDQEQSVRQILALLIEWLEENEPSQAA